MNKRKVILSAWLGVLALGLGWIFWQQEVKYLLPTPVPESYQAVPVKSSPSLPITLPETESKPLFLHFFNPECPCSRFNVTHFNQLVRQYGSQITFKVIIPSYASTTSAKELIEEDIPILSDTQEQIAEACGVYSSPQAVLIDPAGKLYYRGNYNKARYCTQKASNYAEMAINDLLGGKEPKDYGLFASKAYGCGLSNQPSLSILSF